MSAADADDRVVTLDILRGVAVMGILAMNIVNFAMPQVAYYHPLAYGMESGFDLAAWALNFVLFEGKMRGLFSMLFGASMLLVIDRATASGRPEERVHYARMGWLLVFGLLHLFLIWEGDILALYAMVGMVAFAFRDASPATLLKVAAGLIAVQFILYLSGAPSLASLHTPASDPEARRLAADVATRVATELALHRETFWAMAEHRVSTKLFDPLFALMDYGLETLAYMLVGMAAFRSGFASGAWSDGAYRRTMWIGLGIGLPLYLYGAFLLWRSGFDRDLTLFVQFPATVPVRPFMIAGLAALIILATRRGGALTRRIAAAGRVAFTNYLGASVLMTTLFYGWGLGWFGTLSRVETWPVVLAAWALMLAWSKPWLDRFRYGPFEWAWRSLARGRWEQLRRT